jgi:dUTP pyrophosphatase
MIDVKVKALTETAKIPTRAYEHDAGFDLYVDKTEWNDNPNKYVVHFGVAFEIPQGYMGLIFPRSSIYKRSLRLSNAVGVIDSGYRGEVKAVFDIRYLDCEYYYLEERAAQIVFIKLPDVELKVVDELSKSQRGEGGYGSSGS